MSEPNAPTLESRRRDLLEAIANIGELRAGSLKLRYRKCGKPNCHCAAECDPGHGPQWSVSRLVKGRMRSRAVPPEAVERTRRQIGECRRLRALTAELIEVSGALCEARLAEGMPEQPAKRGRRRSRSARH